MGERKSKRFTDYYGWVSNNIGDPKDIVERDEIYDTYFMYSNVCLNTTPVSEDSFFKTLDSTGEFKVNDNYTIEYIPVQIATNVLGYWTVNYIYVNVLFNQIMINASEFTNYLDWDIVENTIEFSLPELKELLHKNGQSKCKHVNKYKNIISNALKFWYCPDCKTDLGDI